MSRRWRRAGVRECPAIAAVEVCAASIAAAAIARKWMWFTGTFCAALTMIPSGLSAALFFALTNRVSSATAAM